MRASPRGLILGVAVAAALSIVPATTRASSARQSRRTSTAMVMSTSRSAPRARRFAGRSPMPAWCT